MIFSHRYLRAIEQGRLQVDLNLDVRRKLWALLLKHNASVGVQRDPNDRWIDNSSILSEVQDEMKFEHGWDRLENEGIGYVSGLHEVVLHGAGHFIFDVIELSIAWMDSSEKEAFRVKLNEIFEVHACPWRFTDGEFFKLEGDFVGARLTETAHNALAANKFTGAADEFSKARENLASNNAKDTIFYAAKSFESVMKALTRLDHANADRLVKAMSAQGMFDDLPQSARQAFVEHVMKTLPALRNKLAGHGQGAEIVEVPAIYGELALQLAAAFHNFLIAKYLSSRTAEPQLPIASTVDNTPDEDIPF
jgi:hypothetical protein